MVRRLRLPLGSASYVVAFAVRAGATAGVFAVLARALGVGEFGRFVATIALLRLVAPVSDLGAGQWMIVASRDRGPAGALASSFTITLGASSALTLALLGISELLPAEAFGTEYLVLLATSELVSNRITELGARWHQVHNRMARSALALAVAPTLKLGAVIVPWLAGAEMSPTSWVTALVIGGAGSSLFVAGPLVPIVVRGWDERVEVLKAVSGALPFSAGITARYVYADSDKMLLSALVSPVVAGLYGGGYRLVDLAVLPLQAIQSSQFAHLVRAAGRDSPEVLRSVVREVGIVTVTFGVCSSVAVWLLAPELVAVFLGPGYEGSVGMVRWVLPVVPLASVHMLAGDVLTALGAQTLRARSQVVAAVLNVSINLVTIPLLGWQAAATSTILVEAWLASDLTRRARTRLLRTTS